MKKALFLIVLISTILHAETYDSLVTLKNKFTGNIIEDATLNFKINQDSANFFKDKTLRKVTFKDAFEPHVELKDITFEGNIIFEKPETAETASFDVILSQEKDVIAQLQDTTKQALKITSKKLVR